MISSLLYFYFYSLPASFIVRLLTYPSESRLVCRETRSPVACAQATDMRTRNIIRTLCRIRPIMKKYSVKREKPRAQKKAAATHIYIFPSLNTVISYLLYHSLTFCQYNIFKKSSHFFCKFFVLPFYHAKAPKTRIIFHAYPLLPTLTPRKIRPERRLVRDHRNERSPTARFHFSCRFSLFPTAPIVATIYPPRAILMQKRHKVFAPQIVRYTRRHKAKR